MMNVNQISIIRYMISGKRILFPYLKDYHALYLLGRLAGTQGVSIPSVRRSCFAKLLDRPLIKSHLGEWGDGMIYRDRLQLLYQPDPQIFRLGFQSWGSQNKRDQSYNQTSRVGHNLVLQLNFSGLHNKAYQSLIGKRLDHPFKAYGHPSLAGRENTLAWARIDISKDFQYALIEEIQNDWLRYVKDEIRTYRYWTFNADNKRELQWKYYCRSGLDLDTFKKYFSAYIYPLQEIWMEAMLTATVWFLLEEIGVRRIFYHTYQLGCNLKRCSPPRSLYSQLPKKLCFQETDTYPPFLHKRLKKTARQGRVRFFLLEAKRLEK